MRSRLSPWLLAACLAATTALPSFAAPGWLGVSTQPTDADLRRGLDLSRDGLLVNRVFDGTPAERAGLQKGDVILRFNGSSVTEPEQLRDAVRSAGSGKSAKLEVWRDGASKTLDVKLVEVPASEQDSSNDDTPTPPSRSRAPELERNAPPAPPAPRAPKAPSAPTEHRRVWVNGRELTDDEIEDKLRDLRIEGWGDIDDFKHLKDLKVWTDGQAPMIARSGRGRLGVRVEKLSSEMGEALGVTGNKGVVVLEVIEDTPAQKAGLRAGDVILEVGGREVADRDDLTKALAEHEGRVDIVLTRKGARRTVQADLPTRSEPKSYRWESGPGEKTFTFRIPEPGHRGWVYRSPSERDGGDEKLRAELDQLKQEMDELKQQLGEKQDKAKPKASPVPKASTTPKPQGSTKK